MKKLIISLASIVLFTINASALVSTWDFGSFADDPWEIQQIETVEEIPAVVSGSFNA
jgi:hypothetical protein